MIGKEKNIIGLVNIQNGNIKPDFFETVPGMVFKLMIIDDFIVIFAPRKKNQKNQDPVNANFSVHCYSVYCV